MRIYFFTLIFSTLLVGLPLGPGVFAGDQNTPEYFFEKANLLYQEKHYPEAAVNYQKALQQGLDTASVHYNLGNCWFRQGKLGKAIACYLRAQRLDPRNADIRANLKFALSLRTDKDLSEKRASLTSELFSAVRQGLTLQELMGITVILFWLLCLFIAGRIWWQQQPQIRTALWITLILYSFFAVTTVIKYREYHKSQAVVISPSASMMSGPNTGTILFTIHEGAVGTIRREHGQWVQLILDNGLTGWLERERVEVL